MIEDARYFLDPVLPGWELYWSAWRQRLATPVPIPESLRAAITALQRLSTGKRAWCSLELLHEVFAFLKQEDDWHREGSMCVRIGAHSKAELEALLREAYDLPKPVVD